MSSEVMRLSSVRDLLEGTRSSDITQDVVITVNPSDEVYGQDGTPGLSDIAVISTGGIS